MSAVGMCASVGKAEHSSPLRAHCEVNGAGRDCRILDLNSQRAFVESFVPAPTGSEVTLRFSLPNGYQVCTSGVVSYHQFRVGFGVDLIGLSPNDYEQINSLTG
jgi:hypothetical protein